MLKQSLLNGFRLTVSEQNLGVYGVHVYQEGEGCVEHRFRNDDPVNIYSASKTFTAVGIGICLDDGKLKLEDFIADYFPEYHNVMAEGSERITIRDLLHMSSGKRIFWPSIEQLLALDAAEVFFREPMTDQPGEHFFYSNLSTYMLGRIVEKVSGRTLRDTLEERLFTPMEILFPQWHACPKGHTLAATELYLRTSELARLGELLLHGGIYHGQRLVSDEFVSAMHTDWVSTAHHSEDSQSINGYGYQVWRCADQESYRADGMYGQFTIVIPACRSVVTATSHNEGKALNIIRAIFSDIVPLL